MKSFYKIKNGIIVILILCLSFLGYQYSDKTAQLQNIYSTLNSNAKLKSCFFNQRKIAFMKKGGEYLPDYEKPRTLNDKVVYYLENYFLRSPITKIIGTKYFAKVYISDTVGSEYVVRLFGVWDNPEDIDFDKLPNSFVLKTVRGNYGREVIIVRNKNKLNINETVKKMRDICKSTPGMIDIKDKRIIAEELLEPESETLVDYKFFCSFGKPFLAYCLDMKKNSDVDIDQKTFSFYSIPDWKRFAIIAGRHEVNNIPKPKHLNKMLELCGKLSKNFPLIRIDLYEIGDRVLVGEITEDASGGKNIIDPVIWDFKFGEGIPILSKEEIQTLIEKDKIIAEKYLGNVF